MIRKLLIVILLQSAFVNAQVAGYMGKRLSLGYSNYFSPSFIGEAANATEDYALGINTTHCANIEYTIKNRTNFCFGVQFSKLGVRKDSYSYTYTDPYGGYLNTGSAEYIPANRLPMQLKMTNIAIGFKFFRSGYIAPLGRYNKLEFILFMSNVTYDAKSFYKTSSRLPEYKVEGSLGTGNYDFKECALALTFGRQRILFDRLIIDTGIRFAVSPNAMVNYFVDDIAGEDYNTSMEHQVRKSTNARIFTAQLFNFHIGLGFLAF
jgi:hypothetical protein